MSVSISGNPLDVTFLSNPHTNNGSYTLKCNVTIDITNGPFTPVILGDATHHFKFNGNGHTITIKKTSGSNTFSGVFDIINGTVCKLNVNVVDDIVLAIFCGWINTTHFDGNNIISNICTIKCCTTNGSINNDYTGGITGASAGAGANGRCEIINCSSSGEIKGTYAGGSAGANGGSNNGICKIINCTSSGDINGNNAGGSAGANGGSNNGKCEIINCTSSGNINGNDAGGSAGSDAGSNNGICKIINCTSSGDINGNNAGGSAGSDAGNNGYCEIINCTSSGNINGLYAGGISGDDAGSNNGICNIIECISFGKIEGENGGGIAGHNAGANGKCYILNSKSVGDINGANTGGIAGQYAGAGYTTDGNCEIKNCSSSGEIKGMNAGGSVGQYAGYCANININGNCKIINCTSSGEIKGENAGGSAGQYAGYCGNGNGNGNCKIINCTSSGDISNNNAGGIVGSYAGYGTNGNCEIANCSSSGEIKGENAGGSAGRYAGNCKIINCTSSGDISNNNAGGIAGSYAGTKCKILYCIATASNIPLDSSSGRIVGSNSIATVNECFYYKDNPDQLYGSGSTIISTLNHPTINIKGLKLFQDKNHIKECEYDGVSTMGIEDDENLNIEIKKKYFCRDNVHPLKQIGATQRDTSNQTLCNWSNMYFKFTLTGNPSGKMARFWIPNSLNSACQTDLYGVFKNNCQIGSLSLVFDGSLDVIEDSNGNKIFGSSLWEFTFPSCLRYSSSKTEYTIIRTGDKQITLNIV